MLPPSEMTGSWQNRWSENCEEVVQQWNADGVPASRSTTYRRIKEMGCANRIAWMKPLLNFKQYKKWLTWVTEKWYWTVGEWSRAVFSDECISWWVLHFVRKTEDHEFGGSPTKLTSPTTRNSALNFVWLTDIPLMVWGHHEGNVSSWSWTSVFLRTNVTSAFSQEVLEHFLLPTAEQLFGGDEFTFQHDLAPAHNAKSSKTWFITYEIQVLSWLANSSDLNLIKNLRVAKNRMVTCWPTMEQLKVSINQAWSSITSADCQRLVKSMPRQIQTVIAANGRLLY